MRLLRLSSIVEKIGEVPTKELLYLMIESYGAVIHWSTIIFPINYGWFRIVNVRYTAWWFGTCFTVHILGMLIPTDELIFFRGVGAGRYTTKQL